MPTSWHECLELLGRQSVGRLAYHEEIGPVVEPVNYAIAADTIILRIEGGSKRQAMTQPLLAFEVDHIDPDNKTGWSVIARRVGQEVPLDHVAAIPSRIAPGRGRTTIAVGFRRSQHFATDHDQNFVGPDAQSGGSPHRRAVTLLCIERWLKARFRYRTEPWSPERRDRQAGPRGLLHQGRSVQ
jgi:hypothetical protein